MPLRLGFSAFWRDAEGGRTSQDRLERLHEQERQGPSGRPPWRSRYIGGLSLWLHFDTGSIHADKPSEIDLWFFDDFGMQSMV